MKRPSLVSEILDRHTPLRLHIEHSPTFESELVEVFKYVQELERWQEIAVREAREKAVYGNVSGVDIEPPVDPENDEVSLRPPHNCAPTCAACIFLRRAGENNSTR